MTSRDRLTDAMASLLWERGYAATSPKDVLERAGVGQGSMYHHFAGKHVLAVVAFRSAIDALLAESRVLDGDGTPLERIERDLTRPRPGIKGCRVGRMAQDPQVVADPDLIGMVAGAFDTAAGRWARAIDQAVSAGELPAGLAGEDLAQTLCAVIQGGYVLSRAQNSQEPMDAAIRGVVALLDAASAAVPAGAAREPATGHRDLRSHAAPSMEEST